MRRVWVLLAAGLVLAGSSILFADEGSWQLAKEKAGVQVFARKVEGWEIREISARAIIPAPLRAVVAVIHDVENTGPQLSDVVRRSEVVARESETRYTVYSEMDMPWPLSDRDAVNVREIHQDSDSRVVTITDDATATGPAPKDDLVRIQRAHQRWVLEPMGNGETRVELRVLVDPNGPVPASIINSMSVGQPIGTLERLGKLVQEPVYRDARPAFVEG